MKKDIALVMSQHRRIPHRGMTLKCVCGFESDDWSKEAFDDHLSGEILKKVIQSMTDILTAAMGSETGVVPAVTNCTNPNCNEDLETMKRLLAFLTPHLEGN